MEKVDAEAEIDPALRDDVTVGDSQHLLVHPNAAAEAATAKIVVDALPNVDRLAGLLCDVVEWRAGAVLDLLDRRGGLLRHIRRRSYGRE